MDTFELDCDAFMKKHRMRGDQLVRAAGIALDQGVTIGTPVDTGRARANWNCAVNEIDRSNSENTQLDGMKAMVAFQGAKLGDTLTITNSLPYVEGLEHGNSKQAPNGMVAVTVEDVKAKIEGGGIKP